MTIQNKSTPFAELRSISRSFPGVQALQNVDLRLRPGTIHALLGENGAGKSTLINVLGGVLQPDNGSILIQGEPVVFRDAHSARRQGIAIVHQEADLFPTLSVAENVAHEHGWPTRYGLIDWRALQEHTRAALQRLGSDLSPRRLAAGLSAAERQLVGIAAALAQRARLLILDEPTSSLSANESAILFEQLRSFRSQGGAILYVSHRLEEVFALADEMTILRDGRLAWTGPLTAIQPEEVVARMVGREPVEAPRSHECQPGPARLVCQGLRPADGSFAEVSLEARAGEVLGLYGLIGAGRSEWAQCLFGLRPAASGEVLVDGRAWQPTTPGAATRAGLAYLPEDRLRQGIFASLAVQANLTLAALRRLAVGTLLFGQRETATATTHVRQLQVKLRSLKQPIRTLSGGNQQKVVLGRWLACDPGILILDEPTRGVDVGARSEIHQQLRRLADEGRAIVMISSDLAEVMAHSDRIGVFRSGHLVAEHDARTVTAEQIARDALPSTSATPTESRATRPAPNTNRLELLLRETGLLLATVILAALLAWRTETFWQVATLQDILTNAALLALCGLAAGLVLLAGSLDISYGALMAVGGATAGYLMQNGHSPLVAISACLLTSTFAGALNAGLSLAGGVHPIVITLGTLSIYRGLTLLLIGDRAIHDIPASFRDPLLATPGGVPMVVLLVAALVFVAWLLLRWTVPGRKLLALGSNAHAARRTGIHQTRVWLVVFAVQGFLAGLAALFSLGLAGHMQATDFEEKTLDAIGVAVVGGIAISGGRGSVWGICSAALLFRVLEKGWVLLGVSSFWQRTIVGGLLLLAILGDRLLRRGDQETA